MKQIFQTKGKCRHFIMVFALAFISNVIQAQKSTPATQPDPFLSKRTAVEVIERNTGEWSAKLQSLDPASVEYKDLFAKYAMIRCVGGLLHDSEKPKSVVQSINEASAVVWREQLVKDQSVLAEANSFLIKLLSKQSNPQYKENQ